MSYHEPDRSDGDHYKKYGLVQRLLRVNGIDIVVTWCGCNRRHSYLYEFVDELSPVFQAKARKMETTTEDELGSEIFKHIEGMAKIWVPPSGALVGTSK